MNHPTESRPLTRTEPWADYQRQVAGAREARIGKENVGPEGEDERIWADSLHLDPDTVVAAEAKYVNKPGQGLYEGKVPPRMQDFLLRDFDREMHRYAQAIRDPDNPVGRLRIIASTAEAARFLEDRARRILGPAIDLQVRYTSPKGQP
jgi:hypothetical protein